ncbi:MULTISPECIES: Sec-independent protein translocase protein TatB [Brevundimonas]|uniref:Sec-independent protein translocase protein TatB n=1 Tax=Brevundimonas TaxID=41275 RepID=UPI000F040E02|nr:Sec-independent protein translocase protein TatB [Brevundimonas lutea]
MGGLGPGIGGLEILVIGLVALLVVGPKDLPVLMRRVGQWMARARNMAAEFRASFDEMARQSELDELRKEVEALRHANPVHRLGADADAAFKDIKDGLNAPATPKAAALAAPDPAPQMTPIAPPAEPVAGPEPKPKPRPRAAKPATAKKTSAAKTASPKTASRPKAEPKASSAPKAAARKTSAKSARKVQP